MAKKSARQSLERFVAAQREDHRRQWETWLDTARQLEADRDRFRDLYDAAPAAHLTLDRHGLIHEVNRTACALFQVGRPEFLVGKPLLVFVARSDVDAFLTHLRHCRAHDDVAAAEVTMLRRRTPPAEFSAQLVSRRGCLPGGAIGIQTVISDVSWRGASERARADSERRYREIVETANEGICISDDNDQVIFVNRKFAAMMGRAVEQLLGSNVYDFLVSDVLAPDLPPLRRRMRLLDLDEVSLRRADGSLFWASLSASPMLSAASQFSGLLQMYTDISERKQLQRVRDDLVRRLVSAQEDERGRVARELHDQLGQHLVGLSLGLTRLAQLSHPEGEAAELIRRLGRLSDEMSRDVHHLALELRPAALDDLGLVTAVSNYADDLRQRSGIEVDIHCEVETRLSPAVETTVYRIVQEALTNVVKHAKARHVSVILKLDGETVRAIIEDDGVGFSLRRPAATRRSDGRLGVAGMEERATLVNGRLQIESRPGRGTTVFLSIPVSATENRGSDEEASPATGRRPRRRA